MMDRSMGTATAFAEMAVLARGPLVEVALAVKAAGDGGVLVFDDASGAPVDLDLRGTEAEIRQRLQGAQAEDRPRGRGRPKLGVVPREVTLLPRHWEWLAAQSGGASATLRRLVDAARRDDGGRTAQRAAQEAAYRFMSAMAGDLPGFEEATRALFAGDGERLEAQMSAWPADVRSYALELARVPAADLPAATSPGPLSGVPASASGSNTPATTSREPVQ